MVNDTIDGIHRSSFGVVLSNDSIKDFLYRKELIKRFFAGDREAKRILKHKYSIKSLWDGEKEVRL